MNAASVLELRGVRREGEGRVLLDGVDLTLRRGERLGLLGASGSGKSTLLRLVARLDDPHRGRIAFHGRDLRDWDPLALRCRVRLLVQTAVALPGTAADNLALAAELAGRTLDAAGRRALLGEVGLAPDLLESPARRLSGGELQRLALARALVSGPELLALDEPTAHLDLPAARTLLRAAARVGTLLVATHDLESVRGLATRVVVLDRGRVVEEGRAAEFFRAPGSAAGRRLLGGEA